MSIFHTTREADSAASQVRSGASTMNSLVAELHRAGVWTGPDADKFVSAWQTDVTDRLLRAASRIDNLVFTNVGA